MSKPDLHVRQCRMSIKSVFRLIRRKPLLVVLVLMFYLFYSLYFSIDSEQLGSSSVLQSFHFTSPLALRITPPEVFDKNVQQRIHGAETIVNSLTRKLFDQDGVEDSSWKLTRRFHNNKLAKDSGDIAVYTKKRQSEHIYDPRITLAVYLNHLKEQYRSGSDTIPFSWEDWVDLSYLNRFLHGEGRTCASFLTDYRIKLSYEIDQNLPSTEYANRSFCLDNADYMQTKRGKFRDEKLLPGFNFMQRINEKSNFIGKLFNAKSYLLSYAPTPSLIYFLNENGTYYKVKPYESSSMMRNGMFETFVEKNTYNGFDPVEELENLGTAHLVHNENDFTNQLMKSKNFQLKIPESHFQLDSEEFFSELYNKDVASLEENERNFIESLEFSKATAAKDVKKYFKEVNIIWPASYNGHRLKENGGHFDARFFSGFVSEMPLSEFTFHSPYFAPRAAYVNSLDNPTSRRSIVLSHLLHTLLTATFHDGLFLFPAHGSLLAWYFTSMSFPYDGDGDVQMPVTDLAEFCLRYNNSLIVQNPRYGTGRYYVDCTSSLTHRGKESGTNNIDARVIDVDTGMFVDITGIGVSADRLSASDLNKMNGWIPRQVRNKYPASSKPKGRKKGRRRGAVAVKNEPASASKVQDEKEMEAKVLQIHIDNKIYNCRNDHFYTYEQFSPVRLTLFEGAPTFVAASKDSLTSVLEQEYRSLCLRRVAWEDWVYSKQLQMWIHADDIQKACVAQNLQPPSKSVSRSNSEGKKQRKNKKKKVKGANVLTCYNGHEGTIISDLVKRSLYDITSEGELKSNDGKRPHLNVVEELYHDNLFTSAHSKEMMIYHSKWEWKTPQIQDRHEIPENWKDLAKWMLEDHAPPKMALLDYLVYVEAADDGKEIVISASNRTEQ